MSLQGDRPEYWDIAKEELSRKDVVLHEIINRFDDIELVSRGDLFYSLIRSVIGQQISVKAASTVWSRFCETVGDIEPQNILSADIEDLRKCGLSQSCLLYTSPSPRDT